VPSCLMWREAEDAGADDGAGDDILGLGGEEEGALGAGEGVADDVEDDEAAMVDLVEQAGPITCRNPEDVSVSAKDHT